MNFFVLIVLSCLLMSGRGWAEEIAASQPPLQDALIEDLMTLRDPFKSPLVKKKVEPPAPEFVRPANPPVATPAPIPQAPVAPVSEVPAMIVQNNAPIFPSAAIKVSGIIWNTALPQAIVNDHVVKIGDDIEGAKIVNITRTGIEVMFYGTAYNLSMADPKDNFKGNPKSALRRGGR